MRMGEAWMTVGDDQAWPGEQTVAIGQRRHPPALRLRAGDADDPLERIALRDAARRGQQCVNRAVGLYQMREGPFNVKRKSLNDGVGPIGRSVVDFLRGGIRYLLS